MNIIEELKNSKVFKEKYGSNLYKYENNKFQQKLPGFDWNHCPFSAEEFIEFITNNELIPYVPIGTFENDIVKFTVKETDDNYELQFQEFPDELRGIGRIGRIGQKTVESIEYPLYDYEEYTYYKLYLPGKLNAYDNSIINIPKPAVSKDFFKELFELITEKALEKIGSSNIFFSEEYARKFMDFSEEQLELMIDLFRDAVKNIK